MKCKEKLLCRKVFSTCWLFVLFYDEIIRYLWEKIQRECGQRYFIGAIEYRNLNEENEKTAKHLKPILDLLKLSIWSFIEDNICKIFCKIIDQSFSRIWKIQHFLILSRHQSFGSIHFVWSASSLDRTYLQFFFSCWFEFSLTSATHAFAIQYLTWIRIIRNRQNVYDSIPRENFSKKIENEIASDFYPKVRLSNQCNVV